MNTELPGGFVAVHQQQVNESPASWDAAPADMTRQRLLLNTPWVIDSPVARHLYPCAKLGWVAIVDMHAAGERIVYEKMKAQREAGAVARQRLQPPPLTLAKAMPSMLRIWLNSLKSPD